LKTSILSSYNEFTDENIDYEKDDADIQEEDEIEIFFNSLSEVEEEVREYFQTLDQDIPTEKTLTEEQIVNMILTDEKEESDSEEDEISSVSVKKAIDGLKTFINYFEQQDNFKYNINDLQLFQKYLQIVRVEKFNSKKQSTLDMYCEI